MRDPSLLNKIRIFGGSSSTRMASAVCESLGIGLARGDINRLKDHSIYVRVDEKIDLCQSFIIQSVTSPVNDNFMELLFWIDALKRAGSTTVTAVIPYFSYAVNDLPAIPVSSQCLRVCADALESAGANRIITLDAQSSNIQALFKIPVVDLKAFSILRECVLDLLRGQLSEDLASNIVVVSPDEDVTKSARVFSQEFGGEMVIAHKYRSSGVQHYQNVTDLTGKTALIVDNFISTSMQLITTAEMLAQQGARRIFAVVTHGAFGPDAIDRLENSRIEKLIITNSIETQAANLSPKVKVVSVAPLFAEAINEYNN